MMICPLFFSNEQNSVVDVVGCYPGVRYIELKYESWPEDNSGFFASLLRSAMPVGTRCYGGYFIIENGNEECYTDVNDEECNTDVEDEDGDQDYCMKGGSPWKYDFFTENGEWDEYRWIHVLVDFGGVNKKVTLDPRSGCFDIYGLKANVNCFVEEVDYAAGIDCVWKSNVFEAWNAQYTIERSEYGVWRFGRILLRESGAI